MNEFIGALVLVGQLLTGRIVEKHWIDCCMDGPPAREFWVPETVVDYAPEQQVRDNPVPNGKPPVWWFIVEDANGDRYRVRVGPEVYHAFTPGDSISWEAGQP